VSDLVYESEKLHHGTPSGIDNTVVAHGMPIWYVKGEEPERFRPGGPFTLAIADSGIASPTKETVGDVRCAWERDPIHLETLFDEIGAIVTRARAAIEAPDIRTLGALFDRNQTVLEQLGVSSPTLRRLIGAARETGALGAKLSGGGRGGNIIALVEADTATAVASALTAAGAARVITTTVAPSL
jgi:mevalonate kinase